MRPPLPELLAGLDRQQLESLLLRLAEQEPALADQIDALLVPAPERSAVVAPLPAVAPAAVAPALAGPGRRTPVDVASFHQQVQRIFRHQRSDDYSAYHGILAGLAPLVAQIRGFLDGDDAQSALPLLEAMTDDYSAAWVDYDDSDGELGLFFEELGALWAESLLGANPKKAERKRWRERLEAWAAEAEEYGCEGLDIALQAAAEGWSEPWIDGAILGEARPDARPTSPFADEIMAIRLRILERSGHIDEALNLAAAAGMHRECALLLLRLGRGAEAAALGQQHFRTADEALDLAQALRERGDLEGALAIGERGLSLGGDDSSSYGGELAQVRLGAWLVDVAMSPGT